MNRKKLFAASAVGAAMLAGVAGTAAIGHENGRMDGRQHQEMKQDGKGWQGHHRSGGGKHMHRRGGMEHGLFGGFAGRHVEGMLAFAKTEIGITEAQEAQWTALADAVRQSSEKMNAMRDDARASREATKEAAPADAPRAHDRANLAERLDRMEAHAEARLEMLKQVNAAFKPLYASLSEEQKQKVDELVQRRGHGRG